MKPIHRRRRRAAVGAAWVAALAIALGACENVKEQLGLNKSAPDEFTVLTHAPLSLPPDYKLRPPDPGAVRPQETSAQDQVKAALYGAVPSESGAVSSAGENAILSRIGATEADPEIRRIINEENGIYAEDNQAFVDSLIFWRDPAEPGVIVDAAKESQRLQEAEALGEAPTEGETAIIEPREKGWLEGIF